MFIYRCLTWRVCVCFRNWKKFLTCLTKAKIKTVGKKSQGECGIQSSNQTNEQITSITRLSLRYDGTLFIGCMNRFVFFWS